MWKIYSLPMKLIFKASPQGGEFPDYWKKKLKKGSEFSEKLQTNKPSSDILKNI